jgi:hypothetical protein
MAESDNTSNRDLERVAQELTGRLRTRGIDVADIEDPEEIERVLAAVEGFERAVMSQGGDLMVDEPPVGSKAKPQPDDPAFLLPTRTHDESTSRYVERLEAATQAIVARGLPR